MKHERKVKKFEIVPAVNMPERAGYRSEVHAAIKELIDNGEGVVAKLSINRVNRGQLQSWAHTYAKRHGVVIQTVTDDNHLWIKIQPFPHKDADIPKKGGLTDGEPQVGISTPIDKANEKHRIVSLDGVGSLKPTPLSRELA